MSKLVSVVLMVGLLPFMGVGLIYDFARFGFDCGRDMCNDLLIYAFKKGGAK